MASKIKVDQIEGSTASTITLPSGQTLDLSSGSITLPDSAVDLSTAKVTGTLGSSNLPTVPVSKGGTGVTSLGTANQVLGVNSGATALEFQNVANDFVKISSNTLSSDASYLDFKTTALSGELDFSTYKTHRIELYYCTHTDSSFASNFYLRFLNSSGSMQTSANYGYFINSNHNGIGSQSNTYIQVSRDYTGSQSGRSMHFTIDISDFTNTSFYKNVKITYVGQNHDTTANTYGAIVGGDFKDTASMGGIRCYFSSGNIASGLKYNVYGIK